jgi:hypothetical protein
MITSGANETDDENNGHVLRKNNNEESLIVWNAVSYSALLTVMALRLRTQR